MLSVKCRTLKLLEGNIGETLWDQRQEIVRCDTRIHKRKKVELIKIKNFCSSGDTVLKHAETTHWGNIFTSHICYKGVASSKQRTLFISGQKVCADTSLTGMKGWQIST